MATASNIIHITGDLFTAPAGSILVHACNTVGSWSGGIATAFLQRYPTMFEEYKAICESQGSSLLGTCLLIRGQLHNQQHDVACLFTSEASGRRKDSPEQIISATRSSVKDLMEKNTDGKELHACRFNSGKFAVPWEQTEQVLNELGVRMTVYDPPPSVAEATERDARALYRARGQTRGGSSRGRSRGHSHRERENKEN